MSGPPEAFLLAMKFLDKNILGMGCMYKHIYRTRAQNSFMHIGTHLFIYNWNTYINQHNISTISPWIVIIPNKKNGCRKRQSSTDRAPPEGRQHHRLEFWEVNLTWQSVVTEGSDFVQPGNYIYIYILHYSVYIYILYYSIYIYIWTYAVIHIRERDGNPKERWKLFEFHSLSRIRPGSQGTPPLHFARFSESLGRYCMQSLRTHS